MDNQCNLPPKPKTFKAFIQSRYFLRPFIGVVVGAVVGYLYYYFVGCAGGSCPLTSNPYASVIGGGLFGYFIVNSPCTSGRCG